MAIFNSDEVDWYPFHQVWQSHMDSMHGLNYTTGSVWELVVADYWLQYMDLMKLDGAFKWSLALFPGCVGGEKTLMKMTPFFCSSLIVNALRNDMEFEQSWVKIPMYLNQELIGLHSAVVGRAKNKLWCIHPMQYTR